MNQQPNNEALGNAIEQAFNPGEPVAIGTAISMAVTGTLTYLSFYGTVDNDTIGVISALATVWLPIIGLLVRSQYTPYKNRTE